MTALLIIITLIGLIDSLYIAYKKGRPEPLLCPIGGGPECDAVVKSQYSKILGIPNEYLGATFYLANLGFLAYTNYVGWTILNVPLRPVWLIMAATGALAAVALTYLQLVVLKHICDYCMVANAANLLIFLILVLGY